MATRVLSRVLAFRFSSLKCIVNYNCVRRNYHNVADVITKENEYIAKIKNYMRSCDGYKDTVVCYRSNDDHLFAKTKMTAEKLNDTYRLLKNLGRRKFTVAEYLEILDHVSSSSALLAYKNAVLDWGIKNVEKFGNLDVLRLLKIFIVHDHMRNDTFLEKLDIGCVEHHRSWNPRTSLLVLDMWFEILNHGVKHAKYFQHFIQNVDADTFSSVRWSIQVLFYASLQKTTSTDLLKKIERRLTSVDDDELSAEELQVICQCFLRNKVKLSSETILRKIEREIERFLRSQSLCTFTLISYCKTIRQAQRSMPKVTCVLKDRLLKDDLLETLNLSDCGHLMAVLASEKVYDEQLYRLVCNRTQRLIEKDNEFLSTTSLPMEDLKSLHLSIKARPKDVARIVWIFAEVGHECENGFVEQVVRSLRLSLKRGLCEYKVLLDTVVSLAVMNRYVPDLIDICLSRRVTNSLKAMKRAKIMKQLIMLDQSLALELVNYSGHRLSLEDVNEGMANFKTNDLNERPSLKKAMKLFDVSCGSLVNYECCQSIPYISISGITFNDGDGTFIKNKENFPINKIAIEVLDSSVCLNGTYQERGFMKMKCRQLAKMGYKIVKIPAHELGAVTDDPNTENLVKFGSVVQKYIAITLT